MLEIAVALVVVLVLAVVPPLRRAALSLLGLLTIIGVGSALFAAVVWGLYQTKPWLSADEPAGMPEASVPEIEDGESTAAPRADLTAALAAEDDQRLQDEQQRLEEEKRHRAIVVARARMVLEDDRKLAAQATSYPLPAGAGDMLGDLMAIRIPAWRDRQVAAVQKESIRTWLQSIGLTPEETASVVTAKAWGSLYDLWVAENPTTASPNPQASAAEVAPTSPASEAPADEAPLSGPGQSAGSEAEQEPPPFVRQAPPPGARFRAAPKRIEAPRRPAPSRPSQRQRAPGPFGY